MKRTLIQLILSLIIISASLFSYLKYPNLFQLFENRINDLMFIVRGQQQADQNIIIVDIDEKSLLELGQWPWSRNIVAKILQNLTDYGIGIMGFDVVFAEPDNSSPKRVLGKLNIPNQNIEDFDETLAQTIASTPTIVGYVFALEKDGIKPGNPPKSDAMFIEKNKPQKSLMLKPYRAILNLPIIQDNAYSNGYFNTVPDRDGIVRSIPMLMEYNGQLYPSLSLEIIRAALGESQIHVEYFGNSIDSITMGDITIPTDQFGRMIVNYRGAQHRYKYISASDIYHKRVKPEQISEKIALIGASAAGLLDLRSTPFDSVYPGVEVHANALDNILNKNFLAKPQWTIGANVLGITLAVLVTFGILLIPSALLSFFFLILLNATLFYSHYYAMITEGILFNTFIPLIAINLVFLFGESINYYFERKLKNRIKSKFAAKVSSAVVEELIKHQDDEILTGTEKEITIFFSDIRGFTSISERMGSAKELISLLNEYMTPMVDIITKRGGTVDKFIGDAIMAYWNAPIAIEKHADEALKASIEQIQALKELNKKLEKDGKPTINIGIGLNSGVSVIGEMGSAGRSDFTCIGDSVNLASRSEGLCKPYGVSIVLTEFTKSLLKNDNYLIRELDIVRVKGKEKPVSIYECAGDDVYHWGTFKESLSTYEEALEAYRNANFKKAKEIFENLLLEDEHTLYKLYIERCEHYIQNPPSNFDGVFTFQTK